MPKVKRITLLKYISNFVQMFHLILDQFISHQPFNQYKFCLLNFSEIVNFDAAGAFGGIINENKKPGEIC